MNTTQRKEAKSKETPCIVKFRFHLHHSAEMIYCISIYISSIHMTVEQY